MSERSRSVRSLQSPGRELLAGKREDFCLHGWLVDFLEGDCIITVLLTEDDEVQSDDAAFYLVFTGSAVQHCSSTRKLDSGTLETLAPGHDCCETVRVSLCATQQGSPVLVVAEDNFQFVQDEAYDAAQFLASCAGNQQALNFTRFLDRSRPPTADVDFLDEKVVLAFRHLKLPAEWNVLGAEQRLSEHVPRETLLHFAVRLGLLRLTWFLLQQPGGPEALGVPNRDGATPTSLALERGHLQLHQLLAEEGAREPDAWSSLSHTVHSGEHLVKHHRGLNVYTLTAEATEGRRPSLQSSVQQLRLHMESHQQHKMTAQAPDGWPAGARPLRPGRLARPVKWRLERWQREEKQLLLPRWTWVRFRSWSPPAPRRTAAGPGRSPGACRGTRASRLLQRTPRLPVTAESKLGRAERKRRGFLLGPTWRRTTAPWACQLGFPGPPPPRPVGDPGREAGVPGPPGAAPGQGSCCGGNAFRQEAQITAGRAAESVAEPPASCRDCGVGMGQAECRSCAGGQEAAAVPQGVGGGGCGCGAPGRVAVETGPAAGTALTDPAGAASGGGRDAAAPCRTEGSVPEPATVLQGGTCLDADRTVGTDAPAGSARRESATRSADCGHLAVEGQRAAACRGAEVGEGHTAGALETVPGHRAPALGASVDGEGDVGGSGGERGAAAAAESGGPDPRWRPAPESSGAGGAVMERAPGMPAGPETFEPLPGGVADPPGPGPREEGGGPGLGPDCAGASAPAPAPSLGPTGSRGPFGRQPAHAQELLLLASALLVREAVQQAQLTVAQESSSRAAPGGQEAASRHPEPVPQTLLPLPCGEGPECVQGNLMGTPSARHSAGSEQQQAAAAAAEQPAEAGRGRPASGEPAAGPPPPADSAGREADGLPSPRLPGKEEALAEGPAPALAEPSPPGSRGEALPGSDGHAPPEPAGEASRLGTGEGGRGVLPGPGQLLSGDGSVPAGEALPREPEPEPCPARPAASPLSGPPGWMEAPLLPVTASLPGEGEGEGEGVDGLPSRVLLQPIAEELLGDGDSGPEGPFLAHRGGSGPCAPAAQPEVSAQPSECRREASGVQTVPSVRPACPAPDPLEKAEAEAAEAATAGTSLDPSPAREAAWAGQAPGPPAAPPAGTPADAPFAVEPRLDAQREMGAASPPDGGTVVSLQPGGLTERMTGPPPAADSREMEPEEERGSARGLAEEDAAAEETVGAASCLLCPLPFVRRQSSPFAAGWGPAWLSRLPPLLWFSS
ncbi:hypothetical protein lerEdw1_011060 [Lerista edwardsae]|nr:hypothetical protein lerEdw1_011060 [Lerista edwardsae]